MGIYREGCRPEGYIYSHKPPNASRWYITDIHRLDMVYILCIMLSFDEVYVIVKPQVQGMYRKYTSAGCN